MAFLLIRKGIQSFRKYFLENREVDKRNFAQLDSATRRNDAMENDFTSLPDQGGPRWRMKLETC